MNDKNDWLIVKDLDGLINSTRALVFNNFGKNDSEVEPDILSLTIQDKDMEEINSVLSFDESKNIICNLLKKQKNKNNSKYRFIINDDIFLDIVTSLNDRMVSNILSNLVKKGLIDTAYDNEANDFVFWIKENDSKKETY